MRLYVGRGSAVDLKAMAQCVAAGSQHLLPPCPHK